MLILTVQFYSKLREGGKCFNYYIVKCIFIVVHYFSSFFSLAPLFSMPILKIGILKFIVLLYPLFVAIMTVTNNLP